MGGIALKTVLAAAIVTTGMLVAAQANAHDSDRWDKWDRWDHRHHRSERWHDEGPRRVVERPVIVQRPVVVERPVVMARPAPVYMAPMMPAYAPPPVDPSVNFNFSFPMR
jgi:hypothetical protein